MKFIEVLVIGLDFHFGVVVAQSLEALEASDHLGFYGPSYESDHFSKSAFVEESILFFSLRNFKRTCVKSFGFNF